jgi:catechol 2,3-dioxygenase-like lactoylglutathione lyase family enzyme
MTTSKAAPVAAFVVPEAAFPRRGDAAFRFRGAIPAPRRHPMLATSRLQAIVCTSRPREAETFYTEVLGLVPVARSLGACVYDVGGTALRVSPVPCVEPSAHTVLGFAVDDLDAAMAGLAARGVAWERFPGFAHADDGSFRAPDGSRVAWLRDPDGNLLSIVQYG